MLGSGKWLFISVALALTGGITASGRADNNKMIGMVVGRTGSVLHIGVPQPVREGTIFEVKPFESEPPIAEAKALSCTQERPYMVLAKVIRGDAIMSVPTGVRAYADVGSVQTSDTPQPQPVIQTPKRSKDKFAIQAGAFYPSTASVRDTTTDYWQSYRLTYSFMRMGQFETLLSAEYSKADGNIPIEGGFIDRSTEVIPITLAARFRPVRMGNAHLFVGAGAGMYSIRTKDATEADSTESSQHEFGQELSVGMESTHGWVVEFRYRDIQNTDLQGYLLTLGSRF